MLSEGIAAFFEYFAGIRGFGSPAGESDAIDAAVSFEEVVFEDMVVFFFVDEFPLYVLFDLFVLPGYEEVEDEDDSYFGELES